MDSATWRIENAVTYTLTMVADISSVGEPDTGDVQRNAEVDAEPRVRFNLSVDITDRSRESIAVGLVTVVALTWPVRAVLIRPHTARVRRTFECHVDVQSSIYHTQF